MHSIERDVVSMNKGKQKTLAVGQNAPDFALRLLNGEEMIKLSDFRGKKPVVLVFGSYT